MAQQQQTVLRVQTNIPNNNLNIVSGSLSIAATGFTYSGSGTTVNPYTGTSTGATTTINFTANNNGGSFAFNVEDFSFLTIYVNGVYYEGYSSTYASIASGSINVQVGDVIRIVSNNSGTTIYNSVSFNPIPPVL